MIYFQKITEYQSEIRLKFDGRMIGTLEKLANVHYLIEIDYFSFVLPVKQKAIVKGVIENVYKAGKAREFRARKKLRPYKDFKILE